MENSIINNDFNKAINRLRRILPMLSFGLLIGTYLISAIIMGIFPRAKCGKYWLHYRCIFGASSHPNRKRNTSLFLSTQSGQNSKPLFNRDYCGNCPTRSFSVGSLFSACSLWGIMDYFCMFINGNWMGY